jgi:DNA (cytosine-5)-methyltransferase 1
MTKRLLDLFCGAGGAAWGYHLAGFEVVGVDNRPQPRYPFAFVQGDALNPPVRLSEFDAIHASPPCQLYSIANNIHGKTDHPNLLAETRGLLESSGVPWVLENVPGAPMRADVVCCGLTFGLGVKRHRWFESSVALWGAAPCPPGHPGDWVSVFGHCIQRTYGHGKQTRRVRYSIESGRKAMGISWMDRDELSQAIPPAYTEYIGRQLMEVL